MTAVRRWGADEGRHGIGPAERTRLAQVADALIPAEEGMPAASAVEVSGRQLDLVLAARPDLEPALRRALRAYPTLGGLELVKVLQREDPEAHEALTLAVAGGYYLHPTVRALLGYPGQTGEVPRTDEYVKYVLEGVLDPVLERGPIYREPPPDPEG